MALPSVNAASYPTVSDVKNAHLRSVLYAGLTNGLTINVLPGSDVEKRATVLANRISPAVANGKIGLDDYSPLKATGTKLDELAGVYGVARRSASQSAGYVVLSAVAGSSFTVPSGFQCQSAAGKLYATTSTNIGVGNGSSVQIRSVEGGADTELDAAELVTWTSASIGSLKSTATVDSGGISGGADADDDERLRSRLLNRLAFPEEGGNWAQVKAWAEEATSAVEFAYPYPAARGPGSLDVAVTKEGGDRTLTSATVATVAAFVSGKMPGFESINVTSVSKNEIDVVINATLPLPVNAGGSGGGWRDASPYPSTNDAALAKITAINAGASQITVNSTSSDTPVLGKHIALWDPVGSSLLEYTITAVSGSTGAYVLTLDGFSSSITTGMYVSAGAFNLSAYCAEFLDAVQLLGPGEKTTNTDIIPRALRKPPPDVSNPSALTIRQLDAVTSAHAEVQNLEFAARFDTGTTTNRTSPPVPATTADPPKILVLKHLAFRRQV